VAWLWFQADLGLAPRTVEAYGRGVDDYLGFCARNQIDALNAERVDIVRYIRDLRGRRAHRAGSDPASDATPLATATLQQRLVAVRLFYDHLIEEGRRDINPVGRGRYTPGKAFGARHERGLVPSLQRLAWIPTDEQWQRLLCAARDEPIRNRAMFALAYDAGLRREELCSLRSTDLDPSHRTLRIRALTTKTRRERVVPYSAAGGRLLSAYLVHRNGLSRARGSLFLSESRRNLAEPISPWTWSKVVRSIALCADVPQFSTHTLRHLCLTDLARSGWELYAIATFAGHRNTATTLQYIHLSGRDLAAKLGRSMAQLHAWRIETLAAAFETEA
jgi:site-specific recombinase XerD